MTGSAARIILGDMLRKVTSVKVRYLAGSYGMLQQKIRIGWSPSVCACIVIFLKHYYAEDRIIVTFNTFSYEWAITIVVFLQSKAAFPLGARLLYSLGTNVNTHPFSSTQARIRSRCWCPNTKVGPCVHTVLVSSGAVHCFVIAVKLMFQNGV